MTQKLYNGVQKGKQHKQPEIQTGSLQIPSLTQLSKLLTLMEKQIISTALKNCMQYN